MHWISVFNIDRKIALPGLKMAEQLEAQGKRALWLGLDFFPESSYGRDVKELAKLPENIDSDWVCSFLKSSNRISSLQFKSNKKDECLEKQWGYLQKIISYYDFGLIDLGDAWNITTSWLLKKSSFLFFTADGILDAESVRPHLEKLSKSFFPSGKISCSNDFRVATKKILLMPLDAREHVGFNPHILFPRELISNKNVRVDMQLPFLLHEKLVHNIQNEMEICKQELEGSPSQVRVCVAAIIRRALSGLDQELPLDIDRSILSEQLLNEFLGLGPLEELMSDSEVDEILVNGRGPIYIEKEGKLQQTSLSFGDERLLKKVIERILAPVGRRVDESSPMVDCRLSCGSRVNIILPPLSPDGPILSIRRFAGRTLSPEDWLKFGSVDEPLLNFLSDEIIGRKNILISGGTGSGKTTLLNMLSTFIPKEERIVSIEDALELQLGQPHVVRLETRPPNIEGKGEVTIRDLVRNALRMRPDRIIIGECRGGEALDMLSAMNTGHEGSLTTLHANTPRDALSRLQTLVLFAGIELPLKAIQEQILGAIDYVIQIARFKDGTRKITAVTELTGLEGSVFTLRDRFIFQENKFYALV